MDQQEYSIAESENFKLVSCVLDCRRSKIMAMFVLLAGMFAGICSIGNLPSRFSILNDDKIVFFITVAFVSIIGACIASYDPPALKNKIEEINSNRQVRLSEKVAHLDKLYKESTDDKVKDQLYFGWERFSANLRCHSAENETKKKVKV
jgi:hypothetical protein